MPLQKISLIVLLAYSPMGKELDSLADLISFGLAPGFMAMHFMLYDSVFHGINDSYQIWWALSALLIPIFSALRLAKFNIDARQTTSFIGLPVPANALFWIGICQAGLQISQIQLLLPLPQSFPPKKEPPLPLPQQQHSNRIIHKSEEHPHPLSRTKPVDTLSSV